MKILIVTMGYFPGERYGGPPVSVENFCRLMADWDHYVVTKDHDLGDPTPYTSIRQGWNSREGCQVLYLSDRQFGKAAFEEVILQLRPDWIYLQSLFQSCVISCLALAKKHRIPVLLAPRGELCKGAFRKKYKKIPYIAVLRTLGLLKDVAFQSTSQEETEAIGRYLGAKPEAIRLLDNVPSVSIGADRPREKQPGKARLVFLSRIHPKKNLLGAIRSLMGVEGDVELHIYGPIEDAAYWAACQKQIEALPPNVRASYQGLVPHDRVHQVFREYDAFLFPTFSENYGHVIVEAMSVGCAVILSDQTPWNDVSEHGAGWAIPLDRMEGFTQAIRQVVAWDRHPQDQVRAYLEKKQDLSALRQSYRSVFEK